VSDAPRTPDAPRAQLNAPRAMKLLQFSYALTNPLWNDALQNEFKMSWNFFIKTHF